MTDKRKTLLKWIAIFTCVAVVTVGVTLAVCFSNQEKILAPGFTFDHFSKIKQVGDTIYMLTPQGDILSINESYAYQCISLDKETMVCIWEDKTFTVVGPHGVQHVNQTVNRFTGSALFLSSYGDAIYFIDNEEFHGSQNSLWRYDVENNAAQKLDTITNELKGGMVSSDGTYFALLEKGINASYIHLYDKEKKIQCIIFC